MMNRWKPTMNSTATSVTHLLGEKNGTRRETDLRRGPFAAAYNLPQPRRPHVTPEVAVVGPPHPFGREYRVAHHRRNDVGEVLTELREAGTDPNHHDHDLQGDDHVGEIRVRQYGEDDQDRQVLLA